MEAQNQKIFQELENMHHDAHCELNYTTPFELLVAVVLSAQCTDERVNKVTLRLFERANTPKDFVEMDIEELEGLIYSCGFYHSKARAIKSLSEDILKLGYVPTTQEELMRLRGVGRKTANVVCSVAFGANAIAVDTHVFRVSNRLGIASAKTPEDVEKQLMQAFDEDKWGRLHHLLIFHGRYVCHSQRPDCANCRLMDCCKYYKQVTGRD